MVHPHSRIAACASSVLLFLVSLSASAQDAPSTDPKAAERANRAAARARQAAGQPTPTPSQPTPTQPAAAEPKPGETPKQETPKADDKPKTVQRPTKPATAPDPKELEKFTPDADGMVQFNFNGQPWLDVLERLAKVSGLSLDWQELPADYLNLSTRRKYTVDEARDIINAHLLARGYTLLLNGEVLSVANLQKLNPAAVPRVDPAALAGRADHEFVKVSFPLDWLVAESAVEEFKPMMSPVGKLTALTATNRLEAIDAVINLRELYSLIRNEQSTEMNQHDIKEFALKHTRAADVVEMLKSLLGMSKPAAPPMSPQQMQQMQQMQQQMAQQAAQQQGKGKAAGKSSEEADIELVANKRQNSVLAFAPPDIMARISQAIELIDVPSEGSNSILRNMERMDVYRLATADPQSVVKILQQMGDLDPLTTLEVDEKSKSIIAIASLADHYTIRALLEKVDGSSRTFYVLRLRRLQAEYVAGTVRFMLGVEEKDNKQQQSSSYYYGFSRYSDTRSQETDNMNKFRVDADTEHNRLLLWANELEIEEVQNLLVKLGETPQHGNPSKVRIIEAVPGSDSQELIDRLKQLWPDLAPNELVFPETDSESSQPSRTKPPIVPEASVPDKTGESEGPISALAPQSDPIAAIELEAAVLASPSDDLHTASHPDGENRLQRFPTRYLRLAQFEQSDAVAESAAPSETARAADDDDSDVISEKLLERLRRSQKSRSSTPETPPPIIIKRGPDGRLILDSDDTRALDYLEDLIADLSPRPSEYKIFQIKHAFASYVALNLEEFFDTEEGDEGGMKYDPYFGRYNAPSTVDKNRRLSNRRPLKFISDIDTNTILVQGADPEQLATIQELIDLYDRAEQMDSGSIRTTQIFPIRYSNPQIIADALKDLYRDLLSENDRALNNGKDKEKETVVERSYSYIYADQGNGKEPAEPIKFKGLISIGVDELSSTLIVSATGTLMQEVSVLVGKLDAAAKPTSSVKIINVQPRINLDSLRESLNKVVGPPPPQAPQKPEQQGEQPQNGQQPVQQNGNGGGVMRRR